MSRTEASASCNSSILPGAVFLHRLCRSTPLRGTGKGTRRPSRAMGAKCSKRKKGFGSNCGAAWFAKRQHRKTNRDSGSRQQRSHMRITWSHLCGAITTSHGSRKKSKRVCSTLATIAPPKLFFTFTSEGCVATHSKRVKGSKKDLRTKGLEPPTC